MYDPGHFTPYYNAGLCSRLGQLGQECTLITSEATFERVEPEGYEVRYEFFRWVQGRWAAALRHRPAVRRLAKALAYPLGVWRTWRLLRDEAPGVFHIHFAVMPPLDALLAGALRRRGWHVVYTLQEALPAKAWSRWKYGRVIDASDVIAMHGEDLAGGLREMFPGAQARIVAVTHGMDLPQTPTEAQRRAARAALGVAADAPLLLFFGMLKPYKGLEELLAAMPAVLRRVPEAKLCIAGEPLMDLRPVLAQMEDLPKGSVIFHPGFVPQEKVADYFAAADLVTLYYREIAASSVLLQAQAHGRAVLASRAGAMPVLLEQGRCGFLADEDLAGAIVDALSDRARLAEVARRGRLRVEQKHSWEAVAAETLELYAARAAAEPVPVR